MPEKRGGSPKLDRSRDVTGRVDIIQSLFCPEFMLREQTRDFQKLFSWDIFLHLLNTFATAASKLEQKISKIMFQV